jgi:carbonic anhydrase/acetyltransferase-like protein (isoleucine patch superfamily)
MILHNSNKQYYAISYDTQTFNSIQSFMSKENIELFRISPEDFIQLRSSDNQYLNLVILDLNLRKQITELLDNANLDRFSYIHPSIDITNVSIDAGVVAFPNSTFYQNLRICKDVLVHSHSLISYNTEIGKGTVISPSVSIAGSVTVGNFCFLGISSTIIDHITIQNNIFISAGAVVTTNLLEPGKYIGAPAKKYE